MSARSRPTSPSSAWASRRWRPSAIRKTAARQVSAPLKRALAAAQAPAGLVDVDGRGGADLVCKLSVGLCERLARVLHDGVDRARRERGAKQLAQELCGIAPGDAVSDGEGGDRRLEARAEGSRRHPGRQLGARGGAAVRAAQPLQPMLAEDDRGRRQLRDLMARGLPDRLALRRAEHMTAAATTRPVLDDLIDAFKRKQETARALVAGLATPLSARGRLARPRWRRGRIGRGWQRGVARASAQALLELCDAGLQPSVRLDQLIDSHQQGERRLPVAVENRLRLGTFHSARVRRTREGPCSPNGQGDLNGYRKSALCRSSPPATDAEPTPLPDAIEAPVVVLAQEVPPISRSTTTSGRTRRSGSGSRSRCIRETNTYFGPRVSKEVDTVHRQCARGLDSEGGGQARACPPPSADRDGRTPVPRSPGFWRRGSPRDALTGAGWPPHRQSLSPSRTFAVPDRPRRVAPAAIISRAAWA